MVSFRLNSHGLFIITICFIVVILYYLSSFNPIGRLEGEVISVKRLLTECIYLSEEAGKFIKYIHISRKLNERSKYSKNDLISEPLTDADLGSHEIITKGLSDLFENLKLRSEEHSNKKFNLGNIKKSNRNINLPNKDLFVPVKDLVVWIDPLDATKEFTESLLQYVTVMICIVLHGHPIAGIIHQPFLNTTYWAWNSYSISSSLNMATSTRLNRSIKGPISITYSQSHLNNTFVERINKLVAPQSVEFLPAGGSGFKTLSLISGKADLYIHPSNIRRWDICAAQAILESVGGRLTGLNGLNLDYSYNSDSDISSNIGILAASNHTFYNEWVKKLHNF